MLRKLVIWFLALALIITMLPLFAFAEDEPAIQSQGALLMDMKSGKILYQKNEHQRFYPASITKILTAIIALEQSNLADQVTVSKLATEQEGNRVYLAEGETQSMENLLYGLMLNSGNDAAVAIAEHISGSVDAFAQLMNQKAIEIGAQDSHFVNPNGLHDPQHYTTPYDMSLIARYAMQNPEFRKIVKTETLPWHGKEWESVLYNINPMLYNYDGANGVKTGYTDQARQTMVVSAARGDQELVGTLMYDDTKRGIRIDTTALLDYGFANFETKKVIEKDSVVSSLSFSDELKSKVKTASDLYYTFAKGEGQEIQTQIHLNSEMKPPISTGSQVGKMDVLINGQTAASIPLITTDNIPKPTFMQSVKMNKPFTWWYILIPIPLVLIGLMFRRAKIRAAREIRVQNYQEWR